MALFFLTAVVLLMPTTYAATTTTGTFTTNAKTTGVRTVDGNLIVAQAITFTLAGDIAGTALAHDTVVVFLATGKGVFFGSGTLVGTVLTKVGTIGFGFSGTFTGFPTLPILQGEVTFLDNGTGQLANLSGHGTIQGIINVGGTYSISVVFE